MAGNITIINRFGKIAGWADITCNILGRNVEGITNISYSDTQELEDQFGAGNMPIGYGEGNYQATASVQLYIEEIRAILDSLPPGARLQAIPEFDITVKYEYGGKVYKDIIRNCKFKNNGVEAAQNDKNITTALELRTSHIDWNGVRTNFNINL